MRRRDVQDEDRVGPDESPFSSQPCRVSRPSISRFIAPAARRCGCRPSPVVEHAGGGLDVTGQLAEEVFDRENPADTRHDEDQSERGEQFRPQWGTRAFCLLLTLGGRDRRSDVRRVLHDGLGRHATPRSRCRSPRRWAAVPLRCHGGGQAPSISDAHCRIETNISRSATVNRPDGRAPTDDVDHFRWVATCKQMFSGPRPATEEIKVIQHLSSAPGTQLVHVGRQPIFDRAGDVVGYELLFRGSLDAVEAARRDTYATSQVIVNAFTEFGIAEVVGDRPCFINLTREFLVGDLPLPFGPEQVVLEVLETVDGRRRGDRRGHRAGRRRATGSRSTTSSGARATSSCCRWPRTSSSTCSTATPHSSTRSSRPAGVPGHPDGRRAAGDAEHLALSRPLRLRAAPGYVLSRPQVLTATSLSPSRLRRLELLGALSRAGRRPRADPVDHRAATRR